MKQQKEVVYACMDSRHYWTRGQIIAGCIVLTWAAVLAIAGVLWWVNGVLV